MGEIYVSGHSLQVKKKTLCSGLENRSHTLFRVGSPVEECSVPFPYSTTRPFLGHFYQ
jgi:hypothetical protein